MLKFKRCIKYKILLKTEFSFIYKYIHKIFLQYLENSINSFYTQLEHGTDFYDPDCEACVIRVLGGPCYDCFGQCFIDMYYPDPHLLVLNTKLNFQCFLLVLLQSWTICCTCTRSS